MMSSRDYDAELRAAKNRVTNAIIRSAGDGAHDIAVAVDDLNAAWDELTDCLIRQREVRDETIRFLHQELAEKAREIK